MAKASLNKTPQLPSVEAGHPVSGLLITDLSFCDKIYALGQDKEIGHLRHYKHVRCFLPEYIPVDAGH